MTAVIRPALREAWEAAEREQLIAENERLLAALADVIPLAGMANLTPESQAKLESAKRVLGSPFDKRMRAALEQIVTVCDDNAGPTCEHGMALKFVRDIAARETL